MKIKGPFELTWGQNTLTDVGEIDVDWDLDTESFTTVAQNRFEVEGGLLVKVTLTLLATDIAALAAVLPQYFIAQGSDLSTGETVDSSVGAIDYYASCEPYTYNNLDITSCGEEVQTWRIVNARTRIADVENTDKLRTIMVEFVGEPEGGQAAAQFFLQGGVS